MKNHYVFTLEYDGTDFCGWAKQSNQKTIQGALEKAIFKVTKGTSFRLVGASKTDSGVHAKDQKVWIELDFKPIFPGFIRAINSSLPLGIMIKDFESVDVSFKVRNCKEKIYKYIIKTNKRSVFEDRFYYVPKRPLNFDKLNEALKLFIGEHDFINFSGLTKSEAEVINTKREIKDVTLKFSKDMYTIEFVAKGFIRYQIRMILGAAFAYALNKIEKSDIIEVLSKEANKLPYIADPRGLILYKITY